MKRIHSPGGHSYVQIRRVKDDLHGDMLEIKTAHPEADAEHQTWLSLDAAFELADAIKDAVMWIREPDKKT